MPHLSFPLSTRFRKICRLGPEGRPCLLGLAFRLGLSLALCLSAAPVVAATLTVGTDAVNCDFTDLQSAIVDAGNADVLQLEAAAFTGQSGFNFNISSKSLTLEGGYEPGCGGIRGDDRTILSGGGNDSVLEIFGSGSHFVIVSQIDLTSGFPDSDHGGGLEIDGDFDVALLDVEIYSNTSEQGGGIHIDGSQGATLFFGEDSRARFNDAHQLDANDPRSGAGGGIYCENGAVIRLHNPIRIEQNIANAHGGGIFADGCEVQILYDEGSFGSLTLEYNFAAKNGGGLYATGGSFVDMDGGSGRQASISWNDAGSGGSGSSLGGGVYLEGIDTELRLTRGQITSNLSDLGGGVYVNDRATLRTFGSGSCGEPMCQLIRDNEAVLGGGVAVVAAGSAYLSEAWLYGNHTPLEELGNGSAAFVSTSALLDFENAMVTDQYAGTGTGVGTIQSSGGLIEVTDSTFRGNLNMDAVFAGSGDLDIANSIFWGNAGELVEPSWSGTWTLTCAVVPPGTTLPPGASEISTADPLFVSNFAGDAHLGDGSPAIDLCTFTTETSEDIDGDPRPLGLRRDAGADEFVPPLFADGFESGNTAAWSATVQ